MFFWLKEQTITLIFSLLSYSLLDGRGKRRKRQIFVWVREGRCSVLFCFVKAFMERVGGKPVVTVCADPRKGNRVIGPDTDD